MSRSCDARSGHWLCTLAPGHAGWHAAGAGDEYGFVHCWSDDDDRVAARLAETERRLAALESTLAAAERRLAQTPASSMPDAIEQTEVCRACQGTGYGDDAAYPCLACDTEPFDAVPRWRRLVDEQHQALAVERADGYSIPPLADVLQMMSALVVTESRVTLAPIVAVCEREVGGDWRTEPAKSMRPDDGRYTVEYLIYALSWTAAEASRWRLLGNRAAAWLRSLCEDGAA